MKLQVLGTPQIIQTDVQADTDQYYALNDFSFRLRSSGTEFHVTRSVSVEKQHDSTLSPARTLEGTLTTGGEPTPFSFALQEPLYLPSLTQMALKNAHLQPGAVYEYPIFNPLSGQADTITLTAVGSEQIQMHSASHTVTKIATQYAGMMVHAWLDDDNNVVKEEAALGVVSGHPGSRVQGQTKTLAFTLPHRPRALD